MGVVARDGDMVFIKKVDYISPVGIVTSGGMH